MSASDLAGLLQRLRDELAAHRQEEVTTRVPLPRGLLGELVRRYGLPASYSRFLDALGAEGLRIMPAPFQELVIYAAPELERAQVGFRGSRPGDDAFVAPHGWRRSWVVIAVDAGDPYFLDTSKVTADGECPVFVAMHGTGSWEPLLAASSLGHFLQILTAWVRIVVPHHDPQNPEEPLDDAQARRLIAEVERIDPAAVGHWTQ